MENWSTVLSLGEQQRLAFARVFLDRPRFIVLDEATSALDAPTTEHLYMLLRDMARISNALVSKPVTLPRGASQGMIFWPIEGGMTYVSVGHDPSLFAYHDKKLVLRENGHQFGDIDKLEAAQIAKAIEE